MSAEQELVLRVLGALLREDVVGLRSRTTPEQRPDGLWLRLAEGGGGALLLPVTEDGFQAAYTARLPLLRREPAATTLTTCDDVLDALREHAPPQDRPGFAAFAEECRQTLATMRLHDRTRDEVLVRLATAYGSDTSAWRGHCGSLAHDALAARLDHPVYPTARGRTGLVPEQLRCYAPEFHPRYRPRWITLPRRAVTTAGQFPAWWPRPDGERFALPVHPLTGDRELGEALREAGLYGQDRPCEQPHLDLVPTLSMRTGALADDPCVHLKLPLATATLGLRNRRSIKPGTLVDGAACHRLLAAVIDREPRFKGSVLLADETTYAHAGHELLAVLLRAFPPGLEESAIVPMAALLARAPDGLLVIDHLADRFYGGDPLALLDAVLTLLFDWQTTLFGYGIALESHQQNIQLAFDTVTSASPSLRREVPSAAAGGVRLVLKDNDGPRINARRLHERLGEPTPDGVEFDDARIFTEGDAPLADLFTTITLHLCAGAYAFGLDRHGRAPLASGLRLVRERLTEAVERLDPQPRDVLRERVLDAERLPVKAMVSAGSLLTKERSGAADINKHYTNGPNYLRPGGAS
ncbi:IucA/IucC family protein [Streptomyces humicola]|uniref:IucA/IucC family protein n=1 Tax=Streptomyces humicola TaxID=2953240 RepID=UPI0027E25B49|nr:IucA/IucC family protein [Streptomyces humicola]